MKSVNSLTATTSPGSADVTGPVTSVRSLQILLVDDDDDFRESMTLTLLEEGLAVRAVSNGAAALETLASGENPDVILLDWRMPGMNGLEILHALRGRGITKPVIFLTGLTDDVYEAAALAAGAVDFIGKTRRSEILVRRIELIAEAATAMAIAQRGGQQSPELLKLGSLELRFDINRARWAGQTLDLTLAEFQIVARLATTPDEDISYRHIYDLVRGTDFAAGQGPEGYRVNVRTFIKRIRNKFREIDDGFDRIRNYAGFGYRWVSN